MGAKLTAHELTDFVFDAPHSANITFPEFEDLPSEPLEFFRVSLIAIPVPKQLRPPVGLIRLWLRSERTVMAMPKAAVDKNYLAMAWKDNIRSARKVRYMQPESETLPMDD